MIPRSTPDPGGGTPVAVAETPTTLSVAQWREVFGSDDGGDRRG